MGFSRQAYWSGVPLPSLWWHCCLAPNLKSLLFPDRRSALSICVQHSVWPPTGPQQETHYICPWFFFLVAHLGMWDLSSLARDQTYTPCTVGRVLTTGPRGKSLSLFWMYIFRFCVHILCSSTSFNRDPPPLYFLEIPLVFQGLTQTPPPFCFPWSFSEGLPSPSADLCFFLTQIPCFYSVVCSCWELMDLCLHHWVVPSRVETPSLFIEWMIVSWSLRKTMKEGCSKPRSRPTSNLGRRKKWPWSGLCKVEKRQLSGGFTNHTLPPFGLVTWVTQALAAGGTCSIIDILHCRNQLLVMWVGQSFPKQAGVWESQADSDWAERKQVSWARCL